MNFIATQQDPFQWGWEAVNAIAALSAAVAAISTLIILFFQNRLEQRPYLELVEDPKVSSKDRMCVSLKNSGRKAAYNIEVKGRMFKEESRDILYPGATVTFEYSTSMNQEAVTSISYKRFLGIRKLYLIKNSKSKAKKDTGPVEDITSFAGRVKLKKFLHVSRKYINDSSRVGIIVSPYGKKSIVTLRWHGVLQNESFSETFSSDYRSIAFEVKRIFGDFEKEKTRDSFSWIIEKDNFLGSLKKETYRKCWVGDSSVKFDLDVEGLFRYNLSNLDWNLSRSVTKPKFPNYVNHDGGNGRYSGLIFGEWDSFEPEIKILPGNSKRIGNSIIFYDNRRAMIESSVMKTLSTPYGFSLYDGSKKRIIIRDEASSVPTLIKMSPQVNDRFIDFYSKISEAHQNHPEEFYSETNKRNISNIVASIYWLFLWRPKKD